MDAADLVYESKSICVQSHDTITNDMLCDKILQIHHARCRRCKLLPVCTITQYIRHCLQHLRLKAFRCADIGLLHAYAESSGGILPESQDNLNHFWYTGKIPTSNLQYLHASPLVGTTTSSSCDICCGKIAIGSNVFKLECGHIFHAVFSAYPNCNLLAWLAKTNLCPKCDARVCIPCPVTT